MGKMGILLASAALALSACGYNELSRSTTGAIAGGVVAAATDNDVATGVLIGGAAGALCDDVTPELCPR
jgi:hypothetical protein